MTLIQCCYCKANNKTFKGYEFFNIVKSDKESSEDIAIAHGCEICLNKDNNGTQ